MTKEEREIATVEVELVFRATIEVYRDDAEGSPEEIAEQLYNESEDFDELLARGEKELDALRALDRRSGSNAADLDAEVSFSELREIEGLTLTEAGEPELPVVEFDPVFTDRPDLDEVVVEATLPTGVGPRVFRTTFSKEALATHLRKILGFDRAREKLDKARTTIGFYELPEVKP